MTDILPKLHCTVIKFLVIHTNATLICKLQSCMDTNYYFQVTWYKLLMWWGFYLTTTTNIKLSSSEQSSVVSNLAKSFVTLLIVSPKSADVRKYEVFLQLWRSALIFTQPSHSKLMLSVVFVSTFPSFKKMVK